MAHKIQDDVAEVLRAAKCEESRLTLVGQLDRKMYERVNKILEISGFEWNRKQKCHLAVKGSAAETLEKALDDGEIVDPKKEWDFFQTPEDLAARMADILNAKPTDWVLEPSAGGGRLVRAVLARLGKTKSANIHIVEAQDDLRNALMPICGVFHKIKDFMDLDRNHPILSCGHFDKIIMNPPFSNFSDILHCRHAYDILKPGGRMVCITGPSWKYRTDKKSAAFKEWFESLASATVEDLPAGTFKDSGTNVRALLLVIDKESE